MLRIAGLLAAVALGLSASHTKGTVGEGQLPPPGAPPRARCGSAKCQQKRSADGDEDGVAFKVCAEISSGIFLRLFSSLRSFPVGTSSIPGRSTFPFWDSFVEILGLHHFELKLELGCMLWV